MDFYVLYIDTLITLTADTWQPYRVDKAKSKKKLAFAATPVSF
jgi:hypothetical protein